MFKITKEWLEAELKVKTRRQIAEETGCNYATLGRRIKSLGIRTSKHSHLIREDFFQTWSKDMAYILGFCFADGNIGKSNNRQKLVIQLNPKDIEFLEFITSLIQPGKSIYRYSRILSTTKKPFDVAMVDFSSKYLVEDLEKLGCVENKTYVEIRIPAMPKEYMRHFIRGFFDGDGSVWYSMKSSGYIDTAACIACMSVSFLQDILNELGFGNLSIKDNPPTLNFYSKTNLLKLYEYMYSDGGFCLRRKKEKFELVIQSTENIRRILNTNKEN